MNSIGMAIVTGGAGGIGLATARLLGQTGHAIAVVELEQESARIAVEFLQNEGIEARAFSCDVSDSTATDDAFGDIFDWQDQCDILVNNAGINQKQSSLSISPEHWQEIINVNLNGCFHCIRAVLPVMSRSGKGSIVNIASVSGLLSVPGRASYNAAKHGVVGLTKSYGADLARLGIRVNAVAPGMIKTPMTEAYLSSPGFADSLGDFVAMGRAGRPEEIAEAVAFLASDKASYITGTVLVVDGGFVAEKSFAASSVTAFSPKKKI